MERPMVEKVLRIRRRGVRFAAEASLNEAEKRHLREGGDHTRLEAWRPSEFIYIYIWAMLYKV